MNMILNVTVVLGGATKYEARDTTKRSAERLRQRLCFPNNDPQKPARYTKQFADGKMQNTYGTNTVVRFRDNGKVMSGDQFLKALRSHNPAFADFFTETLREYAEKHPNFYIKSGVLSNSPLFLVLIPTTPFEAADHTKWDEIKKWYLEHRKGKSFDFESRPDGRGTGLVCPGVPDRPRTGGSPEHWTEGTMIEMFSKSKQKFCPAKIVKIDKGKRLRDITVVYEPDKGLPKEEYKVDRYDADRVRPRVSRDYDKKYKARGHIGAFVKQEAIDVIRDFWWRLGKKAETYRGLKYFSTHGRGVPWLHVRLSSEPKQYQVKTTFEAAKYRYERHEVTGMKFNKTGLVTETFGYAAELGVHVGWKVLSVAGKPFPDKASAGKDVNTMIEDCLAEPGSVCDVVFTELDKSAWADSETYYNEVFSKKFLFEPDLMDIQGNIIVGFKPGEAKLTVQVPKHKCTKLGRSELVGTKLSEMIKRNNGYASGYECSKCARVEHVEPVDPWVWHCSECLHDLCERCSLQTPHFPLEVLKIFEEDGEKNVWEPRMGKLADRIKTLADKRLVFITMDIVSLS